MVCQGRKINERWDVICPSPDAWRRNGIKARDWQSSVQNRWRLQATSSAVTLLLDSFGSAATGDYMVAVQTS